MKTEESVTYVLGTILLTLVLLIFSYQLLFSPMPYTLLDYANFIIHEASGIFFIFLGQFFFMLGQNIFQNAVPLMCFLYFLRKEQPVSAAFSLFWLGDNLIQTGIYMKDARALSLPIVSIWGPTDNGLGHDWHYIFSQLNILSYDQLIGGFFWTIGALCILVSIISLLFILKMNLQSMTRSQ